MFYLVVLLGAAKELERRRVVGEFDAAQVLQPGRAWSSRRDGYCIAEETAIAEQQQYTQGGDGGSSFPLAAPPLLLLLLLAAAAAAAVLEWRICSGVLDEFVYCSSIVPSRWYR